ncbi:MAG: methyltransferase domain-containing protein [Planctomycetes bacterium]|nr:methyltransferase domain-containing protein [Planctomycetota bacterium]
MTGPDAAFWQARFEAGDTPWDRGGPSSQLLAWLEAGALQPCRIAVPGCGSGWEVAELASRGFQVVAIDYAQAACDRTQARLSAKGLRAQIIQADVLSLRLPEPVDAVYEQTCLCALHPTRWRSHEASLAAWIRPGGRLHALFAQRPRPAAVEEGLIEGPAYHCDINAMRMLFDGDRWDWPSPPYARVPHPSGFHELGMVLGRRG